MKNILIILNSLLMLVGYHLLGIEDIKSKIILSSIMVVSYLLGLISGEIK